MADLATTYLSISLKNPLVVSASSISNHLDKIKLAEDVGAGALVIRSLFEEQVQLDALRMDEQLARGSESFAEAVSHFPPVKHGGPAEHLMWVERARKAVKMPLFASLNAVTPGTWTQYARQLAETGIDGLELNVYAVATDPEVPGAVIERELYEIVEQVRAEVSIPVAVKLSMFYTSTMNVVHELEKRNINGVVLFNRFLQPDISPETESLVNEMVLSTPAEIKIPLRHTAMLYGRTKLDIALTTGVHTGHDAIKALLAGATVVQMAAALLTYGLPYLSTMLLQIQNWMEEHGYEHVNDFRGKLSQKNCADPFAFERAQYVKLLMDQA